MENVWTLMVFENGQAQAIVLQYKGRDYARRDRDILNAATPEKVTITDDFGRELTAADSAVWGGSNSNTIVGHRRKIHRLPDGGMIAGCGRSVDLDRVAKYLIEHGHFDGLSKLDDTGFNAIWVKPDGTAWWVENDFHPLIIEAPFAVCGASEVFMLGAIHAGATAEEAVRLAIRETDGAAGEVQVERIHPVIAKAAE